MKQPWWKWLALAVDALPGMGIAHMLVMLDDVNAESTDATPASHGVVQLHDVAVRRDHKPPMSQLSATTELEAAS